jgi:polysaccharide biosynthesis/export protein
MLKKLCQGAAILTALFLLSGCRASKENHANRVMLQGIDTMSYKEIQLKEQVIRNGDLLTIIVYSDNKEATVIYNQPQNAGAGESVTTSGGSAINTSGRGYQVDNFGEIYFHSLGKIKVSGLTKNELSGFIQEKLKQYLQNPYVVIRFTNNRVTILGDVLRPGVIEMPDQKLSILDAIGFAGDFTPFGRRDNVLVIRENGGKREIGRLDLRKSDAFASPFFYLQQNDMVYVEPNRKKPTGNEQLLMRNVTIVTSIVSVIVLLTTLLTLL